MCIPLGNIPAGTIAHPVSLSQEPLNDHNSNVTFWGFAINPNVKLLLEPVGLQCPITHFPIFSCLFIMTNTAVMDQCAPRLMLNSFVKGCLNIFH